MKNVLLFVFVLMSSVSFGQIAIDEARMLGIDNDVTIRGVVTSDISLGQIRYIQDGTAGLAINGFGDFNDTVLLGDSVEVSGALILHNGLLEINPITEFTIISSGNDLPTPKVISAAQLGLIYESELVQFNSVGFDSNDDDFPQGTIEFSDGTDMGQIYLTVNHPLIGEEVPVVNVDLVGISSRYNNSYRLLPRDYDDLVGVENLAFVKDPKVSSTETNGLNFYIETNTEAQITLKYSTDLSFDNEIEFAAIDTEHNISITGLNAATIYNVEVEAEKNGFIVSHTLKCITSSFSSGTKEIYFNHGYDSSVSNGTQPQSALGVDMLQAVINKIEAAQFSIDVSVYNNNRTAITNALNDAVERGVRVRYITDTETTNSAVSSSQIDFPLLKGNTDDLMHNKILIIDVNSPSLAWLMQGSCNFTNQSFDTDYNNLIFIQDQSLAKIFEVEFEEMWGGNGDFPNIQQSKFGDLKEDNTPHLVTINEANTEVYFSPTDNVENVFVENISKAEESLSFCIYFFTNDAISSAVKNVNNAEKNVRGIVESLSGPGAEYPSLVASGVNVQPHTPSSILHHKYCLVDAQNQTDATALISGSYNWTGAGTYGNDENYVIYKDMDIVNVYYQEFEARWCEATESNCTLSLDGYSDFEFSLYPNPVQDRINISQQDVVGIEKIKIIDMNGQLVYYTSLSMDNGTLSVPVDFLMPGMYYILLEGESVRAANSFVKY